MARYKGTAGDDMLEGGARSNLILGLAGNDILIGNGGDDVLKPGTGADTMSGGTGDDIAIIAELDYMTPDTFDGGLGHDTVDLSHAPSTSFGYTYWNYDSQTGRYDVSGFNDPVDAPSGLTFGDVESLIGTQGDDLMVFVSSEDNLTINTGQGNDWVRAGSGKSIVHAGAGNDRIDFGYGRVAFYGDAGDDVIVVGTTAGGIASGGSGVDTLETSGSINLAAGVAFSNGHRLAISNFENISMVGFQDGDVARGDANANVIDAFYWRANGIFKGAGGDDHITGGEGADQLFGDAGNDVLTGGGGEDQLTGGGGADTFRFRPDFFGGAPTTDTITDFVRFQGDSIDLTAVDADTSTTTIDAFRFIGSTAFHGRAGELRAEVVGAETFVQADTDGDGAADLTIRVAGGINLHRADFILVAGDQAGHLSATSGPYIDYAAAAPGYVDPVLP